MARCRTHKRCFTLYPPGYYPYARSPLVPLDSSGHEALLPLGDAAWKETQFKAALDAALEAPAWPQENPTRGEHSWWHTQLRQIQRAGRWLGLEGDRGEEVMQALGVELLVHEGAQRAFLARSFRERGRAVQRVLEGMDTLGGRLRRLILAGQRGGVCGRAWFLHPTRGLQPLGI